MKISIAIYVFILLGCTEFSYENPVDNASNPDDPEDHKPRDFGPNGTHRNHHERPPFDQEGHPPHDRRGKGEEDHQGVRIKCSPTQACPDASHHACVFGFCKCKFGTVVWNQQENQSWNSSTHCFPLACHHQKECSRHFGKHATCDKPHMRCTCRQPLHLDMNTQECRFPERFSGNLATWQYYLLGMATLAVVYLIISLGCRLRKSGKGKDSASADNGETKLSTDKTGVTQVDHYSQLAEFRRKRRTMSVKRQLDGMPCSSPASNINVIREEEGIAVVPASATVLG